MSLLNLDRDLFQRGFKGKVRKDFRLAPILYYQIGGAAEYFVEPQNINDVLEVLKLSEEKSLPLQIIGGGSNLLVRDGGISGFVLYLGPGLEGEVEILNETSNDIELRVPAHWAKSQILALALQNKWGNLEFSAGIPGTMGGAVWMNAGTKWGAYSDVISGVHFAHPKKGIYRKEILELGLTYRGHGEGLLDSRTAILSVDLKLTRDKNGKSRNLVDEILIYRGTRQPLERPNCGSVFKNPSNSERGAGRLIEAAGLKGLQVGNAMVSLKHANFIVNLGGATSQDVETLIEKCQTVVEEKFKIKLEPEVIVLGNRI